LNANDADAAWLPSPVQVDREERLTSPAAFVDAVDEIFGNPFGWNSRS